MPPPQRGASASWMPDPSRGPGRRTRSPCRSWGIRAPAVPVTARLGDRPARQALVPVGGAAVLPRCRRRPGGGRSTAELDPDELPDRRPARRRGPGGARWRGSTGMRPAGTWPRPARCWRRTAGSAAAHEVTLGRLAAGASVVMPPADPAGLGALNRALARARGRAGATATPVTDDRDHRQRGGPRPAYGSFGGIRCWPRAAAGPACWPPPAARPGWSGAGDVRAARQPARSRLDRPAGLAPGSCRSWTPWSIGSRAARWRWPTALPATRSPLPDRVTGGAAGRAELAGRRRRHDSGPTDAGAYYLLAGDGHRGRRWRQPRSAGVEAGAGCRTRRRGGSGPVPGPASGRGRRRRSFSLGCARRSPRAAAVAGAGAGADRGGAGQPAPEHAHEAAARPRRVRRSPGVPRIWPSGCRRAGETLRLGGLPGLERRGAGRLARDAISPASAGGRRADAGRSRTLAHRSGPPDRPGRRALSPARGARRGGAPLRDRRRASRDDRGAAAGPASACWSRPPGRRPSGPRCPPRSSGSGCGSAPGERRPPARWRPRSSEMGYAGCRPSPRWPSSACGAGSSTSTASGWRRRPGCEWWGDDISSIRGFDLTTQRSLQELTRITVLPVDAPTRSDALRPGGRASTARPCSISSRPTPWYSRRRPVPIATRWRGPGARRSIISRWPGGWARTCPAGRRSCSSRPTRGRTAIGGFPRLMLREEPGRAPDSASFRPRRSTGTSTGCGPCWRRSPPTLILCDNEGQLERLEELLEERGRSQARATMAVGALDGGFVMPTLRVLTDHEIFRRARRLRRSRRYRQAAPSTATGALTKGDYVVHLDHGIGIYRGIETITAGEATARGGHRRVRGRRPAQRAALPPGSARAVPFGRRGRRPPAAPAAPAGRLDLAAGPGEDPRARSSRWRPSCSTSTPGGPSPGGTPFRRTPGGSGSWSRASSTRTRRTSGKATGEVKRDMERPRPDGPAAGGRRGLRQDGDRGPGRVQGGAGRQAGGGAGAHDDSGRAARADLHGAAGGFPGARWRCSPASGPPRSRRRRSSGWRPAATDIVIGTHRLLSQGRAVQGPGAAGGGRGAPVRGQAQGAAQGAPALGGRADPDGHADSPDAASVARRAPRPHPDRDAAAGPVADPHLRRALGRRTAGGGVRPGARPGRAGLHGPQPDRDDRDDRGAGAVAGAAGPDRGGSRADGRPRSSRG